MFAQDNAHVQNILHRNENVAFDTPQHRATTHYRRQQYVGHFVNIPDMRDSTNWKNPAESNLLYLDLDKMGKAMPSERSRSYIDALPGSYTDQQSQSSIQSSEVGVHDNRRYCFGNNRFAPTSQEMRQPRRLREYVFLFSLFYHFISFPMLSSTCIKIYFLIIIFFYLDISDVYNTWYIKSLTSSLTPVAIWNHNPIILWLIFEEASSILTTWPIETNFYLF